MITGPQIRAARAFLRWSAEELAHRTGMSIVAIRRAETVDSTPHKPSPELETIRATFEKADVVFIAHPDGSTGLMLRKRSR